MKKVELQSPPTERVALKVLDQAISVIVTYYIY